MIALSLPILHRCVNSEQQELPDGLGTTCCEVGQQSTCDENTDLGEISDVEPEFLVQATRKYNGSTARQSNPPSRLMSCPFNIGYYSGILNHAGADVVSSALIADVKNVSCVSECNWEKISGLDVASRLITIAILLLFLYLVAKSASQASEVDYYNNKYGML